MSTAELFADIETELPDWLPPVWRERLAGTREVVRFSGVELEALHRVSRQPMSVWADEGGYVALGASGSDWSSDVTPHAAKVMDTWWNPSVREVVTCFVEQDGKTAILYNCLGGAGDMDPSTDMVVMPGEKKAGDVAAERIIPMFRNSRRLKRIVSPRADDTTKMLIRLTNGGRVFMSWASSADALSSWPVKRIYFDETDKYPAMVGKEASPITLGEKRVRTYEDDYKIYKSSTPTNESGYIYKELLSCPQIWVWHLRCTHCGDTFRAGAEHLDIPPGATVETVKSGSSIVNLACPCCGGIMTNPERKLATRTGLWVCSKGVELIDPEKVGFHRRSYDCKDVSLQQIAAAKLAADSGDLEAKIAWSNGFECIDHVEEHKDRKEDAILRLCDDRPAGEVHVDTDILTIHIDTQDKGEWYTIRGWRFDSNITSWLVKAGYVPASRPDDFEPLDRLILDSEYYDALGRPYRIAYGIIDSAGHRTAEVYEWCKKSGIFASKGAQGRKNQPVTVSRLEFFPGSNKPIPGGLNLYHLDTHFHKDMLINKLSIDPTDPGAWVLHSGAHVLQSGTFAADAGIKLPHALEEYARQMCVEYRDEKGFYQCPDGKANHLFDCEQMAIALANYLGFANMISDKNPTTPTRTPTAPHNGANDSSRPNWFHNRRR